MQVKRQYFEGIGRGRTEEEIKAQNKYSDIVLSKHF